MVGEEHYSVNHREVKHSDIKLILNKVRITQIIDATEFKKGMITSCWDHQERLPKPRGCVICRRYQDTP